MASTLFPLRSTAGFQTAAAAANPSGNRKPETHRLNSLSSSSSKWWTPLFGWSSDPDYLEGTEGKSRSLSSTNADPEESSGSRSRFVPGGFTEEKAKQLRARTVETATFHDIMYHSAIASRLASDRRNSSDL